MRMGGDNAESALTMSSVLELAPTTNKRGEKDCQCQKAEGFDWGFHRFVGPARLKIPLIELFYNTNLRSLLLLVQTFSS